MAVNWGETVAMKEIWVLAKDNLTTEEKNKLLLATNTEGYTAWHFAALKVNTIALEKILDMAKGNLTTEREKSFLLATNGEGNTPCTWKH
jgi:hypothetical protein